VSIGKSVLTGATSWCELRSPRYCVSLAMLPASVSRYKRSQTPP